MFHFGEDARSPSGQVRNTVGLNGVLIESGAVTSSNAQILGRLKKNGGYRQAIQLRAQAVDDLRGVDFSLGQRLKRNKDKSGIGSPTAASKTHHVLNGRIFFDYRLDPLDRVIHLWQGSLRRARRCLAAERSLWEFYRPGQCSERWSGKER